MSREVEARNSYVGSKVGNGVDGKPGGIVIHPVDLATSGAKVVDVTERSAYFEIFLTISNLREELTDLGV